MKIASLAVGLAFIGLSIPAHAGLIGSTVDVKEFFPNLATMTSDDGTKTVSGAVEYPSGDLSIDITDTQILLTWPGPGSLGFTVGAFNGYEFLFSGVSISGATVDGSSAFNPAVSIVGNNIFLNYQGVNTGTGPDTSIINVSTSASGVPEPGTLTLLGAGLLGLGFRYKRRAA
jgi:PEP-CTERM motif